MVTLENKLATALNRSTSLESALRTEQEARAKAEQRVSQHQNQLDNIKSSTATETSKVRTLLYSKASLKLCVCAEYVTKCLCAHLAPSLVDDLQRMDVERELTEITARHERETHRVRECHKREIRSLQEEIVQLTGELRRLRQTSSNSEREHSSRLAELESTTTTLTHRLRDAERDRDVAMERVQRLEQLLSFADDEFATVTHAVETMCR